MGRKYPLEALQRVRERAVDERAREVAQAKAALLSAQSAASRAASARADEQAELAKVRGAERELLHEGQARAHDLQQGERFAIGAAQRLAGLVAAEHAAGRALQQAGEGEREAQSGLSRARADVRTIELHRERVTDAEERAAELREEEAMLEQWTADRYRKTRG